MAETPRCSGHDACAWGSLCLPGRCLVNEMLDSPHYERFAPRTPIQVSERTRDSRADETRDRVAPDGRENRGASLWRERMLGWLDKAAAFCCGVGCAGIAVYLAIWMGCLR